MFAISAVVATSIVDRPVKFVFNPIVNVSGDDTVVVRTVPLDTVNVLP